MKASILLATTIFALDLSAQTSALNWGAETDVVPSGTMGFYRPRVTMNADGDPVVIWGRLTPGTNYTVVGDGAAFTAPVSLWPAGVVPAVAEWQGSEIGGTGDTLWCVAKTIPEMSSPMYAVRSTDGGYTWGDTLRVDPANGPWSRFPIVAVVGGDAPMVGYMAFDSAFLSPHHALSRLVGGVFQPAVDVSSAFAPGDVCDCCPGGITANDDHVAVLYRNAGSNIRTIWAGVSTDDGSSFSYGAEVDPTNWILNACPSTGPDATIAGDSLRFVWMSGADGGNKVYIGSAHLPDLATGFGDRLTTGTDTENYPRIAANGDTIGVVWQSTASGNADVLFRWSTSGITGLGPIITVNTTTTGQQRTPDIAFHHGAFHIVWSDVTDARPRYRRAEIVDVTGLAEQGVTPGLSAWPSPANDVVWIATDAAPDRLILRDALGRSVREAPGRAVQLSVAGLPAGGYRLSAVDRGGAELASTTVVVLPSR